MVKNIPLKNERFLDNINKVFLGTQLIKYLYDTLLAIMTPTKTENEIDQI